MPIENNHAGFDRTTPTVDLTIPSVSASELSVGDNTGLRNRLNIANRNIFAPLASKASKYLALVQFQSLGTAKESLVNSDTIKKFGLIQRDMDTTRQRLGFPVNRMDPNAPAEGLTPVEKFRILQAKRNSAKGDLGKNVAYSAQLRLGNCGENAMSNVINLSNTFRNGIGKTKSIIHMMTANYVDHCFTRIEFPKQGQDIVADSWTNDPPIFTEDLNTDFTVDLTTDASFKYLTDKKKAIEGYIKALSLVQKNPAFVQTKITKELKAILNINGQDYHFFAAATRTIDTEAFDNKTLAREIEVSNRLIQLITNAPEPEGTENTQPDPSAMIERINTGDHMRHMHEIVATKIEIEMQAALEKHDQTTQAKRTSEWDNKAEQSINANPDRILDSRFIFDQATGQRD